MSGFTLNPVQIAEKIRQHITEPGWHLTIDFDHHARPDFDTGMSMVYDELDRAVITFVGSREEAALVYEAAKKALPQ